MTKRHLRTFVHIAAPVGLVAIGIWLLVGCIYLPIPEHHVGKEKDFRELVGPPESRKPIRAGVITRHQVIAMLGPAPYASADGAALGYFVKTEEGFTIWPLCFAAESDMPRVYAVRLILENDNLVSVDTATVAGRSVGLIERPDATPSSAMFALNEHGPKLLPTGK